MVKKDNNNVTLAVIQTDISYIKSEVGEIKGLVQTHYVTKDEFEPIKKLVYGITGLLLTAVVGAILSLVINR